MTGSVPALAISIIGLGKLGASMAAAFASRGHTVWGADADDAVVRAVAAGAAPVAEPGLGALLSEHRSRIHATADAAEAVRNTSATFVVVPTPSDERGAFSLAHVTAAFEAVAEGLLGKDRPHLVVLTSTVLPGATRYGLIPLLERASGRRVGQGLGVCYSPAFIALGSVVRDFLHPDFVLIGESDAAAGDALAALYTRTLPDAPPVRRMTLENAELTKLALNTFVTTKMTFANMLAELCERIPGGDVDVVTGALGLDRRVGGHYLTGALGYGGPCFPRDNLALSFLARAAGAAAPLAEATDAANRALTARVVERVMPHVEPGATVAVLGLAYKPSTPVVDEAPGLLLAAAFADAGVHVVAHDPLAGPAARAVLGERVEVVDALDACVARADVVLVATPDPLYRALTPGALNGKPRPTVVFDFWRILPAAVRTDARIRYIAGGRSQEDAANAQRLSGLWGT